MEEIEHFALLKKMGQNVIGKIEFFSLFLVFLSFDRVIFAQQTILERNSIGTLKAL